MKLGWVCVLLLGLFRALGYRSPAFQAVGHIYVGMLIGGWAYSRNRRTVQALGTLALLETIIFLVSQVR